MKTLINIMVIFLTMVTIGISNDCDCEEPIDIWLKVSNNDKDYGSLLKLDMSRGYALFDEYYIYLVVLEKDTKEQMIIMFPIGYWETEKVNKEDNILPKNNEEFDWKEYLKNNKGTEIKRILR